MGLGASSYLSREALFGEMPLDAIVDETRNTPWARVFNDARNSLAADDSQGAQKILHSIAVMPGIESRYQIQAWHFYRLLGGRPIPQLTKLVLGVIVEVGIDNGDDLLAVYADRTAHYHNHAGTAVVWKRPNESLDGLIDAVLQAAANIVNQIGPWQGIRRPPPRQDHMRLNILTPSGLHFGEGPFDQLQRDRLAQHLVMAATNVMAKLTTMAFGPLDAFPSN